ncbi:unnamed protein product [Closterium sp. Naga37s-1]|nr:unnamed protein product [Closterium sp. Naga37s-1]
MPPCRSAPVQRCPRAEVPTSRGAHVQRCRSAEVPTCRGAHVKRCRSAEVPTCRGAEITIRATARNVAPHPCAFILVSLPIAVKQTADTRASLSHIAGPPWIALHTSFVLPSHDLQEKGGMVGVSRCSPVPADVQTADTHARALPGANLPPLTSRSLVPCTALHRFRLRSRPPANARVLPPTPTADPADVQKADARHSIPFLAPLVRSSSLSVLSKRLCVFVSSSCKKGGVAGVSWCSLKLS